MSEQFSNPEQALIERLRRAPQPELGASAREAILARMLDAIEHPPTPMPRPRGLRPVFGVAAVVVGAALLASGVLFALSRQTETAITPTPPATFTTIPPTASPTWTATPSLTWTLTPLPSVTPTGTVSPTATVESITVIEGPVQRVDGNVIVIFDMEVTLPPNDPILDNVSVGDVVRVTTNSQTGTTQVVIITPTAIAPATVNPSSGEAWTDDGTCAHPPPDWAPANGWRRRCEGQTQHSNNGSNGNSGNNGNNGNGNGNGHGNKGK